MGDLFIPGVFFETVRREKVTNFTGVPTMLLMLLGYKHKLDYDLSTLRYICFGGGIMPVQKIKELISIFPTVGFVQTYGYGCSGLRADRRRIR